MEKEGGVLVVELVAGDDVLGKIPGLCMRLVLAEVGKDWELTHIQDSSKTGWDHPRESVSLIWLSRLLTLFPGLEYP